MISEDGISPALCMKAEENSEVTCIKQSELEFEKMCNFSGCSASMFFEFFSKEGGPEGAYGVKKTYLKPLILAFEAILFN